MIRGDYRISWGELNKKLRACKTPAEVLPILAQAMVDGEPVYRLMRIYARFSARRALLERRAIRTGRQRWIGGSSEADAPAEEHNHQEIFLREYRDARSRGPEYGRKRSKNPDYNDEIYVRGPRGRWKVIRSKPAKTEDFQAAAEPAPAGEISGNAGAAILTDEETGNEN